MLTHPTLERLIALGLTGMAKAFDDQRRQPDVAALPFEDRLAIMVDREVVERQNKCLATRLKFAGLRHLAVVEDGGIEHQEMVGPLDVTAEPNGPVVLSDEGGDGGAATLAAVGRERLDVAARTEQRARQDLARHLDTLTAPPVKPHLEHAAITPPAPRWRQRHPAPSGSSVRGGSPAA